MEKIELSLIIPTYNNCQVLKETLTRIFASDFNRDRFEIIIVNDKSNDGTKEYLESLKNEINLKCIENQENYGRSRSRNEGVKAARGEMVVFIDDDVWVGKDFIRKHYDAQQENRDAAIVGDYPPSKMILPTIWNKYLASRQAVITKRLHESSNDLDYGLLRTGNLSLKKQILERIGGFDERFKVYGAEDTELGYRLKKNGINILYKNIDGEHYFNSNMKKIVSKAYERGCSSALLVKKYPELWDDMQFHSIFYKGSPWWKNAIKAIIYSNLAYMANKYLVLIFSKIGRADKILLWLLGMLEWQSFALAVKKSTT